MRSSSTQKSLSLSPAGGNHRRKGSSAAAAAEEAPYFSGVPAAVVAGTLCKALGHYPPAGSMTPRPRSWSAYYGGWGTPRWGG